MERDDLLDDIISEAIFTDTEIFTQIWVRPRAVLDYIKDYQYYKYFYIILFIYGITQSFDRASMRGFGDQFSLIPILLLCVILGGLLGWISLYIFSALIAWSGRIMLGGTASTKSHFHLFGYSTIPSIIGLVVVVIQILIFGNEIFTTAGVLEPLPLVIGLGLIEVVCGIYTLVLCVISISILQEFSIMTAILNVIIAIVVIIIPFLLFFVLL